jgi:hypothetical protein
MQIQARDQRPRGLSQRNTALRFKSFITIAA